MIVPVSDTVRTSSTRTLGGNETSWSLVRRDLADVDRALWQMAAPAFAFALRPTGMHVAYPQQFALLTST